MAVARRGKRKQVSNPFSFPAVSREPHLLHGIVNLAGDVGRREAAGDAEERHCITALALRGQVCRALVRIILRQLVANDEAFVAA